MGNDTKIIVVDGGSKDDTKTVAERLRARAIISKKGEGCSDERRGILCKRGISSLSSC